ncbi:carboxymuconolactone decarboxylase family protein [Armatimonas sp.]|uniref:carboxymuconolactone decarboxylase family protein n=1 Tax=Armatimonas sp. TaxID=1872638 RepID=UPI00375222C2
MSSHGGFLRSQGQDLSDVDAVGTGDLTKAKGLAPKERELLGFVKRLTLEPAKVSDLDVEALRKAGWTDEQIFEATFDTALFAFFNRMADAFGLDYDPRGWAPPK